MIISCIIEIYSNSVIHHKTSHACIFWFISGSGLCGQQSQQKCPDLFLQHFGGIPKPAKRHNLSSLSRVYPGFTPGFLLVRHAQNTSAGSCQCGRLFNNFICTAQRNLKEHFLIMFNFHQTIWHPFLPNTLSSTYQCRYQRDFFKILRCDVFKVFLNFFEQCIWILILFHQTVKLIKKRFPALLVAV